MEGVWTDKNRIAPSARSGIPSVCVPTILYLHVLERIIIVHLFVHMSVFYTRLYILTLESEHRGYIFITPNNIGFIVKRDLCLYFCFFSYCHCDFGPAIASLSFKQT